MPGRLISSTLLLLLVVLSPLTETSAFVASKRPELFLQRRGLVDSSTIPRLLGGFDIDDIERRAIAASESWDVVATPFLDGPEALSVEERLGNRADCAAIRVGGYSGSSRVRFVFTNPELGLDADVASAEHAVVLHVTNADLRNSDPIPNVLVNIGVDLNDVGDVIFDGDREAYIVVTPGKVEKACMRLLPKELAGTGITVAPLNADDRVPDDGRVQDMEVQRLDKREQKRRK